MGIKPIKTKQDVHLTSQQEKSRKNLLLLMKKALPLKGETFNRSDLYERL